MKRNIFAALSAALLITAAIMACSTPATPAPPVKETVVVQQTVAVPQTVAVAQTVVVPQTVVAQPTAAPAEPITLTFWHSYGEGGNDPKVQALEKLIAQFEQAHPGVKIQHQNVPYGDYHRKLLTAIAGGTAPDLARLDIIWIPEFADLGALTTLDTEIKDFDALKANLVPGPLSTAFWKGHYYALPLDTNTRTWMWNKEVYDKAGVTTPPKTTEDLLADCAKIKTAASAPCFADGGLYGWAVMPWIWSFGGDITDPEMTKATGYVNGPQTVAAYAFLKEMLDEGYLDKGILGGGPDTGGAFAQDKIASLLEGPWMPGIFASQYPTKPLNWALMPAGSGGSISVVGGEDLAVFQQSKNKEMAYAFAGFMLTAESQIALAQVGEMPVRTDVTDQAVKAAPYFQYFFDQIKTSRARLPHPNWPKIEEILTNAGQVILRGEQDPQKALDDAAAKIDPLLK